MFDKQHVKHLEAKRAVHFVTYKRANYQLLAVEEQFPESPNANIFIIRCQQHPLKKDLVSMLKKWN